MTSGAKNPGVPTLEKFSLADSAFIDKPKSIILIYPEGVSNILSGLMSLWMIFLLFKYYKADEICLKIDGLRSLGIGSNFSRFRSGVPSTSSIIK